MVAELQEYDEPVHQVNVDSRPTAQLLHEGWSWDGDRSSAIAGEIPNADVFGGLERTLVRRRYRRGHSVQKKRQIHPASIHYYLTQALFISLRVIISIYTMKHLRCSNVLMPKRVEAKASATMRR